MQGGILENFKVYALKIRGGCDTYLKRDGKIGTAGKGALWNDETAYTVSATQDQFIYSFEQNQRSEIRLSGLDGQTTGALASQPDFNKGQGGSLLLMNGYVRRLTPRECERLQGFPDDWTLIPYKGKPAEECPDTPRYRALGNSFAVPVIKWLGERINEVEQIHGVQ